MKRLFIVIVLFAFTAQSTHDHVLSIISEAPLPVIQSASDNRYGYEGGRVVKVGSTYHLFVSEMVDNPFQVTMRLAHWTSQDAKHWQRVGEVFASNADQSLWSPMPIYDDMTARWLLFYVAYHTNLTHGTIYRAVSALSGIDGIDGPYHNEEVVLQESDTDMTQGIDSFFPYHASDQWYAFTGSHVYSPPGPWIVRLASGPCLMCQWRQSQETVPIETNFIENPIVTQLSDKNYIAVYDSMQPQTETYHTDPHTIGYSTSTDGIHWSAGKVLNISPAWTDDIRTPLGLVAESDGTYTLLYTAHDPARNYWSVGYARVALR